MAFALVGKLKKYRPIPAASVAAAMVNAAQQSRPGHHTYHYDEILALGGQA